MNGTDRGVPSPGSQPPSTGSANMVNQPGVHVLLPFIGSPPLGVALLSPPLPSAHSIAEGLRQLLENSLEVKIATCKG